MRVYTGLLELNSRKRLTVSLAVAVVGLLVLRAISSSFLAHDDGITMLGVTCNQYRFAGRIPTQQWVPAGAWQDFWHLHSPGCLRQIRWDLSEVDIHPPLYFWLLHLWFMIFGVSIPAASLLNLVLIAATAMLMVATCRVLSVPVSITGAVMLTWALTMSTRAASAAIRPYALLGLFAAVLLLLTVLWFRRNRFRYLMAMVPVVAGGMLTQFLFMVPAATVFLAIGAILVTKRRLRGAVLFAVTYGVAVAAFVAADPGFMNSVQRGGQQAQSFSMAQIPLRIGGVLLAVFETFLPLDPSYGLDVMSVVGCALTFAIVIPVLVVTVRWLWSSRRMWRHITVTAESLPLLLFCGNWIAIVAMFLLFISPQHSMRPVYLYFLTPFLFVGLAVTARRSATVIGAVSVLLVFQLIGVMIATSAFVVSQHQGSSLVPGDKAAIVLDSDRRGIVPPALWPVAPGVPTYVANQDHLLDRFPDLTTVRSRELYYVSKVMISDPYGNSIAGRERVLRKFADLGYEAEHLGVSASMGGADVYRLTRR